LANLFSGNDCGFYSLRGFAACLITVCVITGFIFFVVLAILEKILQIILQCFLCERETTEDEDEVDDDLDTDEVSVYKANKIS
jgi:hypothetical protein